MNNELTRRLRVTAPAIPAGATVKSAVGFAIRLIVLGIAVVILALWFQGGGITGVHTVGAALTSAGRLTGLFGAYLLLLQLLLLARLPFLEWVASFDRMAVIHRLNGKVCLSLILAHVGLITAGYAMTDRISIPAEFQTLLTSYPGMIAALVGTIMLVLVVFTSVVIVRRRLRYEAWYLVHLLAYAGVLLAWFHQVPTGNEFITNPLAAAFWTALYVVTLQLLLLFRVAQPVVRGLWHGMRVTEVVAEGPGTVSLHITGRHLDWMDAHAGQFFLWRFLDRKRWHETHPFSLSAAPDGKTLRITIKDLGDFTHDISTIMPGTRVIAEGPFGAFTDQARTRERVALIAGGIGITPIRALLEEMDGDIAVIYRVVQEAEVVFREELDTLARRKGATVHYVVGDHRVRGNEHLLSPEHLRELVPDIARRDVYLCGPDALMRVLKRNLQHAGVAGRHIHSDQFAL